MMFAIQLNDGTSSSQTFTSSPATASTTTSTPQERLDSDFAFALRVNEQLNGPAQTEGPVAVSTDLVNSS